MSSPAKVAAIGGMVMDMLSAEEAGELVGQFNGVHMVWT